MISQVKAQVQSALAMFVLVLMSFNSSAEAWRGGALPVITTKSESCRQNPSDRFDDGWTVPSNAASPYRGQCIDVSTKRPARILTLDDSVVRFANFQYQGEFYILEVARGSIIRTIYQTENFTPVGPVQPAHTQIRFQLDASRPASIRYQHGPDFGKVAGEIDDFVMSADFMAPPGVEYSPVEGFNFFGLRGHYMNVIRFIATRDRYESSVERNGHEVKQYELDLSRQQMDRLFVLGVEASQAKDINEVYDVLWLNCTTESFSLLGAAVGKNDLRWTPSIWYALDPVAARAIDLLRQARLIATDLPSLNEEWPLRQRD